LIEQIMKDTT